MLFIIIMFKMCVDHEDGDKHDFNLFKPGCWVLCKIKGICRGWGPFQMNVESVFNGDFTEVTKQNRTWEKLATRCGSKYLFWHGYISPKRTSSKPKPDKVLPPSSSFCVVYFFPCVSSRRYISPSQLIMNLKHLPTTSIDLVWEWTGTFRSVGVFSPNMEEHKR